MKKITLTLLSLWITLSMFGQDITGQWNGVLEVRTMKLRVVFHISKKDNELSATMDSPDQKAKGIPVTSVSFEDSLLTIKIDMAGIEYSGKLQNEDSIAGTFKQAGQTFSLNLIKGITETETINRPQEPKKPYPYYSEDITFKNKKNKIELAGTLTLPKKEGKFPAVILITGSGPQNRDEEAFQHKPFLVISDYLTRNGIAVLRYDDRGIAKSKGDYKTATSADFARDVESAIAYLKTRKEINKKHIGLIGHSEGGIIAPMVAERSKAVDFIVLLAGTGLRGDQLLLMQEEAIGKASGANDSTLQKIKMINKGTFDIILKSSNNDSLKAELTRYIKKIINDNPGSKIPEGMSTDDFVKLQVTQLTSPWMQFFIKYDPSTALEKVKCPVLAVDGSLDLQVPATQNLDAIKKALLKGSNKNVSTIKYPRLNHLFQECETGLPDEYAKIEQTFSPTVLEEITKWILKQVK